jgi:tRNA A37 threonylcarbamoyladenosine dehydratase
MDLHAAIAKKVGAAQRYAEPELIKPKTAGGARRLQTLVKQKGLRIVDTYESEERELFTVLYPHLASNPTEASEYRAWVVQKTPAWQRGNWVLYPDSCELVHVLSEADYLRVRTSRNNNLITPDEQERFYNARVGIVGLSIGSSVALALALMGGAKHITLADGDAMELSNLNRIPVAGISDLGSLKVDIAARAIYRLNPYARVRRIAQPLTRPRLAAFTRGLDVIVDECDDFAMKLALRKEAKRLRIPVISGADVGERAVIDVERYDLDPALAYFNGRLSEDSLQDLDGKSKAEIGQLIARLIGPEHHSERMTNAHSLLGTSIVSWPQLGSTAIANGSAVAVAILRVAQGKSMQSDRHVVEL